MLIYLTIDNNNKIMYLTINYFLLQFRLILFCSTSMRMSKSHCCPISTNLTKSLGKTGRHVRGK